MTSPLQILRTTIDAEAALPVGAAAAARAEAIIGRHGDAVAAVLFYGSCLRRPDPIADDDPVFDFYLLVDDYRQIYPGSIAAFANAVLPPNVFYIEHPWRDRMLRAKYAVVALRPFRDAMSPRAFHSYFWARFAQPVRLLHARDATARDVVLDSLADAVVTLLGRTAGLLGDNVAPATLWTRAFQETYRAELRTETTDRARLLYEADRERYDRLAAPALAIAGPAGSLRTARAAWCLRRFVGKVLSVLRLTKSAFTFEGGVDYILWKIERHSGVKTTATAWQRRHPLLAAPSLAWRLYRRGAFR